MRIGVAHHLGWAVLVTASDDHVVVDRRRVELIDDRHPVAPIHHRSGVHPMHTSGDALDDAALGALVSKVRSAAHRRTAEALDGLARHVRGRIVSISLRDWPTDFPTDIAQLRRPPYESRADSVMYRQILAEQADDRAWTVHRFDAARVEAEASALLGDRADEVLRGPRAILGPPWNRDHRMALAATVVAARTDTTAP